MSSEKTIWLFSVYGGGYTTPGDSVDGRNPVKFLRPRWCRISSINSMNETKLF